MDHARLVERIHLPQQAEGLPRQAARSATATQPFAPDVLHAKPVAPQPSIVAGDAEVGVVSLELLVQSKLLPVKRLVSVAPTPERHSPERSAETLAGRLLLHHPE